MDTIFMNSENSKTSEHNVLVLKLTDKLDLRRGQKTVALSNLSIYYTWKNVKSSYNLIVCFYHVTYEFESESTLYSCLNVKELLARSRCHI